jgi:hypothetical protein
MSASVSVHERPNFIGRYVVDGVPYLMPVGAQEYERTETFFARALRAENFTSGRKALIISSLRETAVLLPFERALITLGLIMCGSEASPYDGARTEATIRRFDVAMVAPVTNVALEAIAAAGFDAAKLFRGKIVWAKPDAYERLLGAPDIDLRRWLEIGPVTALETHAGGGMLIDGREWLLEPEGEVTYVSSKLGRAMPFNRLKIPLAVKLNLEPVRAALMGPRVLI